MTQAAAGVTWPDDADEVVGALLTASRVLVGVSARSLAKVEETVTITQFRTLVVLDSHENVNLNGLAELLGVNASTAMRMIDRLLVARLVTRRDNPANRREVLLSLTPAGAKLVRKVTAARRKELAKIVSVMPPAQRTRLISALRAFSAAAREPDVGGLAERLGW